MGTNTSRLQPSIVPIAPKVFAKDSFDRFGDDLTEVILQYLNIDDKFRFECLNKRIRTLIFNRQYELGIYIPFKSLEVQYLPIIFKYRKIMKKLVHLTRVIIQTQDLRADEYGVKAILMNISQFCCHVTELRILCNQFTPNNRSIKYIGERMGK